MKKKLIVLLALCFALNTVAFAEDIVIENLTEETVEEVTEVEEITEIEEIIEPEFTLIVETMTESEESAEEWVTDAAEEIETMFEEVEIETELATEPEEAETMPIEEISEFVTEVASEIEEIENSSEEAASDYVINEVNEEVAIEERTIEIILAEVDSIIIEDNVEKEKQIRIHISGNNLEGRYASIKVSPLNGYSEFIYIKSVELLNPTYEIIEISIPEDISGIYRVDVNVENLKRATQVIVAGESSDSELKCEAIKNDVIITGKSTTAGIKSVMVKILDNSGNIVYLRQAVSEPDGSYTIGATLSLDIMNYVVLVTIEGEAGGYMKTITPFNSSKEKYKYEYICQAEAGAYEDVVVYAKNISDMSKYTYELDYSENMVDDILLVDICALTRTKEIEHGFSENEKIKILSVSNRKIRFTVNGEIEEGKLWSGLLNIIRFKRTTSNPVKFILRVYE